MGTMVLLMKLHSIIYIGLLYKWDGLLPMRISEVEAKKVLNGIKQQ